MKQKKNLINDIVKKEEQKLQIKKQEEIRILRGDDLSLIKQSIENTL